MKTDSFPPGLALCFLMTLLAPVAHGEASPDHHEGPAMNFHAINDRLSTGGHFTENGLETVAGQGVTVVIDLRPAPPEGQKQRLAERGIKWINIPVEWQQPTVADFEEFTAAMQDSAGKKVFVQCQANYRASTMTYLYRVKVEGVAEPEARKDLEAAWQPNDTWGAFIRTVLEEGS